MNTLRLGLAALALTTLGGCAMHQRHHSGDAMGAMDTNAHCDMHRQMMAGKTPAERRAYMDSRMQSMSPERRQQMQEMHQRCQ